MNLNKFLPMTETTYYILISLLEPLHGYGIMLRVQSLSSGSVAIAPGTMYGALENLKKHNLIDLVDEDHEKRRKVYAISDLGRKVLYQEYKRMQNLVNISTPVLEKES
ncbi:MAG: PadR family transcriptional regulator [Anaerolineales bacterium]|nr:PadR family transcriptional regulator [Anaerolineales bacterium]